MVCPTCSSRRWDADRGASLYVNRGDGTFEDRSDKAGLVDQIYALNVARADFDNDGNLDVVLLRGGWEESPCGYRSCGTSEMARLTMLTIASGLAVPIATESAVWGDYDNDGLVDLFVCGEYRSPFAGDGATLPDPRNRVSVVSQRRERQVCRRRRCAGSRRGTVFQGIGRGGRLRRRRPAGSICFQYERALPTLSPRGERQGFATSLPK